MTPIDSSTPLPIHISASVLSADFLKLGDEINRTVAAGIDSFHLDVMDGHMAPNLSYGPSIITAIRRGTDRYLDTHLMIDQPWLFIDDYITAGVNGLIVHAEAYQREPVNPSTITQAARSTQSIDTTALIQDLNRIRSAGIHASVTLNMKTPLSVIEPVLDYTDSVLIMSIDPGFSGQQFMPDSLEKIRQLRAIYGKDIKVDGGVNAATAPLICDAGANVLITASYLYGSADYSAAIESLKPVRSPL